MQFEIKTEANILIIETDDMELAQRTAFAELAKGIEKRLEVYLSGHFMGFIGWNLTKK